MFEKVRGAQPPGRKRIRPLLVRRPLVGLPLRVTWLSAIPFGLMLHWCPAGPHGKARHLPCTGPNCERCAKNCADWRGYLPVYEHGADLIGLVTLTEIAWANLKAWRYPRLDLRGLRCDIMRSTKSNFSAYYFGTTMSPPLRPLLPEPDMRPHLAQLYPQAHDLIYAMEEHGQAVPA